jgi:hypothetical protein
MWKDMKQDGTRLPVPHVGFGEHFDWQDGEWYEDRDSGGARYGRKSGEMKEAENGYSDDGCSYKSFDAPSATMDFSGVFSFKIEVVDVCEKNKGLIIAESAPVKINL